MVDDSELENKILLWELGKNLSNIAATVSMAGVVFGARYNCADEYLIASAMGVMAFICASYNCEAKTIELRSGEDVVYNRKHEDSSGSI